MDKKQYEPTKNENINIVELFYILEKYKKYILLGFLLGIVTAWIYIFLKKPIYELKSAYELGYYIDNNGNRSLIDNDSLEYIIKYNFDKSKDFNKHYPKVEILKPNKDNGLLLITIQDYSNKKAIALLEKIKKFIKEKEFNKAKEYKSFINKQIKVLDNYILNYNHSIKELENKDDNTKNRLTEILLYKEKIKSNQILKNSYIYSLSSFKYIQSVGEVKKSNHPIKPNKKIIYILFVVTFLVFTIFLIYFIEQIKYIKSKK